MPPGQRFTATLAVGVAAFANDGGTLIGGIDRVRFHYEGTVVDVVEPSIYAFRAANGAMVAYYGYWAQLKRRGANAGEALLYVEAIPADATMQARVIGPFSFYPHSTRHDREYTVDPQTPESATNFHSFDAAVARVKADLPLNPRITFKRAMSGVVMTFAGATYAPAGGYLTVEAEAPVTFGRSSIGTTATVDSDSNLRPRVTGLWLKGPNITIDYAFVDSMFSEDGKDFVLDGINLTNSRGANALWRGGPYFSGFRIRNSPWFLECNISNLENVCVAANLVRGGIMRNVSRDIFADARCIVGTRVERHSDRATNDDIPAISVVYTGTAATATIARSGTVDPNSANFTFKWGASSRTFTVGKTAAVYARTSGNGYWFADVVDFVNTTLKGLDPGWSATLIETEGRRASSASLVGLKGQGFGDTNCRNTPRTIVSNFDAHGDWYQQRFNTITENVIAYQNVAYDMQTQNIFLSSNGPTRDFIFVSNALGNDPLGSDYFIESSVFSQLGRPNSGTQISHVVVAHCSMPNQGITFRNDGTTFSSFDPYCLIANNVCRSLTKASATRAIGAAISNNHIHAGQTPLPEAIGTTIGGTRDTLFGGFGTGDFTPAGALLTSLKPPVVSFSVGALSNQSASTVLGWIQPSIPA
ncbi:MAG: hypothetical protein MUF47_08730 [Porphyrobacter sp.]|nr:hypothetical protein [Porphyrobacter sp.]